MLTVHHLNNSRSQRVLWLLEELAVPYEIVKYDRDPKTSLAPAELRKIHPLGKSPVVTDNGKTIAESAAILEYIQDTYGNGKLVPAKESPAYLTCRYFMHYAEGSLMPFLLLRLIVSRMKKAPFVVRPIAKAIAGKIDGSFVAPNVERHVKFIADQLGSKPYFCGDELTIADIQMSYPMEAIAARVPGSPQVIKDWVARTHQLPAFKKALERGGAYGVEV